jgi:hypothetical protein
MRYFFDLSSEICGRPLFRFARRTADYLRACQVIATDAEVLLDSVAPPGFDAQGVLSTRELHGDGQEHGYRLLIATDRDGDRRLWVAPVGGSTDDPAHRPAGPFVEGDFLRLLQGIHIHERLKESVPEQERTYQLRLARKYVGLLRRELGSLDRERIARLVEGVWDVARYFIDRQRRIRRVKRLDEVRGVTWRVEEIARDRARLSCYDRGGILDFHTNAEAQTLPPQVMGTVYADAYAAWVFAFVHLLTGDEDLREAAVEALGFLERIYDGYSACVTMAHHADFKNAGLLETLLLFSDRIPDALLSRLRDRARRLKEDFYLPTNVYALRHHWKTAQDVGGFDGVDPASMERIRRRIRRDLSPDGLIHDNNPGRFYFDSHDLTYHHYSLACLADSLRLRHDPELESILLSGLRFSLSVLTPDGEIAYMGRGANNVYHMASAISAFRYAARRVGHEESTMFEHAADLVFTYLARAQQPNGMLATAVNDQIPRRMAWNHCHTPYNALSAYFLMRAAFDGPAFAGGVSDVQIPMRRVGRAELLPHSRFATIVTPHYYLTYFGGSERSYWWSAPNHFTGAPGIAMLGMQGAGALLPILDGVVTEFPYLGPDPCGRARIALTREPVPVLTVERELRRRYILLDRFIVILTRGRALTWWLQVPVRADGDWRSETSWFHGVPHVISRAGDTGFMCHGIACSEETAHAVEDEWFSNPRGVCRRIRLGQIRRAVRGRGGDTVTAQIVIPFRGGPMIPEITSEWDGRSLSLTVDGWHVVDSVDSFVVGRGVA